MHKHSKVHTLFCEEGKTSLENQTLEKATPWKGIYLTSRLLNTTFAEERLEIKAGSPECHSPALTTMLP